MLPVLWAAAPEPGICRAARGCGAAAAIPPPGGSHLGAPERGVRARSRDRDAGMSRSRFTYHLGEFYLRRRALFCSTRCTHARFSPTSKGWCQTRRRSAWRCCST
jgi:hypothetical protein